MENAKSFLENAFMSILMSICGKITLKRLEQNR